MSQVPSNLSGRISGPEHTLSDILLRKIRSQYESLFVETNARLRTSENPRSQTPATRARRMLVDGYFEERGALQNWGPELADFARLVHDLHSAGISPVVSYYTDFPWFIFQSLGDIFSEILGEEYQHLPDFWVWRIDPARGEAGWKPHRDKGGSLGLFPDGRPKSLTCWIPVNDATPQNGCMYVVPKQHDKYYGVDGVDGLGISGLSSIRALPVDSGDVLVWDQTVLHWGAQSSEFASHPRISMALEVQSGKIPAFDEPLLNPRELPPESLRLSLIGKQILQYQHMYPLSDESRVFAKTLVEQYDG